MWSSLTSYDLLAVPIFIFMGEMLSRSGVAESLFKAVNTIFATIRGGLAYAVVGIGTVLAACVGTSGSATTLLSMMSMPSMLNSGYDKRLSAGLVAGAGTLGMLIPPSLMLIVMGPVTGISVGKLFFAAFGPGLLLASLYCANIWIVSRFRPNALPLPEVSEIWLPVRAKIKLFSFSILPALLVILAVMTAIFFGIAPPTEAGAIGVLLATFIALFHRRLSFRVLKEVSVESVIIAGKVMLMIVFCNAFVGIFVRAGGMEVVEKILMSAPGGRWGIFIAIQLIILILGGPLDWAGVVLIVVPIIMPIGVALGFDPLWWVMIVCVNLQTSFLSPPLATSIYIIQSTTPPQYGVTVKDVTLGMFPYMIIQVIGIILLTIFPQIILWLPSVMIG
jgi:tripartite ATP-independent transporter DctM subunit